MQITYIKFDVFPNDRTMKRSGIGESSPQWT
jgi:hypothetical protein